MTTTFLKDKVATMANWWQPDKESTTNKTFQAPVKKRVQPMLVSTDLQPINQDPDRVNQDRVSCILLPPNVAKTALGLPQQKGVDSFGLLGQMNGTYYPSVWHCLGFRGVPASDKAEFAAQVIADRVERDGEAYEQYASILYSNPPPLKKKLGTLIDMLLDPEKPEEEKDDLLKSYDRGEYGEYGEDPAVEDRQPPPVIEYITSPRQPSPVDDEENHLSDDDSRTTMGGNHEDDNNDPQDDDQAEEENGSELGGDDGADELDESPSDNEEEDDDDEEDTSDDAFEPPDTEDEDEDEDEDEEPPKKKTIKGSKGRRKKQASDDDEDSISLHPPAKRRGRSKNKEASKGRRKKQASIKGRRKKQQEASDDDEDSISLPPAANKRRKIVTHVDQLMDSSDEDESYPPPAKKKVPKKKEKKVPHKRKNKPYAERPKTIASRDAGDPPLTCNQQMDSKIREKVKALKKPMEMVHQMSIPYARTDAYDEDGSESDTESVAIRNTIHGWSMVLLPSLK